MVMSLIGVLGALIVFCSCCFYRCEGFIHIVDRIHPFSCTFPLTNSGKLFLHLENGEIKEDQNEKLRVLCLHGYCSSAEALQIQLGHLVNSCADIADFAFLDGAMEFSLTNAVPKPADSISSPTKIKKRSKRMWWRSEELYPEIGNGSSRVTYVGMSRSIKYIYDYMKKYGGFDVILGHSQGACMAIVLCILAATDTQLAQLLMMNDVEEDINDDAKIEKIEEIENMEFSNPAKLLISLSGFIPRDDSMMMMVQRLMASNVVGISLKSLHVFSDDDHALESQLSVDAMGLFENPVMCVREGGHEPYHDIEMYTTRIRTELLELKASLSS